MISLGSVSWGTSPKIPIAFAYEKQRSGANMQYRVQVTISTLTGTSYFGYPIYMGLTIDGASVSTVTLKEASPRQWSSAIVYTSGWFTVSNKISGTTSVAFKMYSGSGSTRNNTYTYSMAVDPAASKVSASNGTLGTALNLTVTRYNTGFTHTITYKCGSATGTVVTKATASTISWGSGNGNTVALASQNTAGQTVNVTFTITTYNGTSVIGTNSATVSMTIPESVKPSLSLSVSDVEGYFSTYGAFIQGWSKLRIDATPTLAYNSPIKAFTVTADGKSYNEYSVVPVTTGVLQGKGTLPITAAARDARSRSSGLVSTNITVLEYTSPSVTVVAYRCNSSGAADPEGAYMKVGFTATITSLNGKNSASYTVKYGATTLTGTGSSFTSDIIACDVSRVWTVEVTVTDKVTSTTKSAVIPIAFTLMDFYNTGMGVALGKVATRDGFDCAMDAYFTGNVTVGNKLLVDLIYPVGSIYMSTNNVSPQTFFGGTWERIQDRFLLAAGSTYAAGGTGGAATHTLTVSEMPNHYHVIGTESGSITKDTSYVAGATGGAGGRGTSTTDNSGGGGAHNNMPPYLTVYMWKRTK